MKTSNRLTDLGNRIFLDRYSLKDSSKSTLRVGDKVLVVANQDTGQRDLGTVEGIIGNEVRVLMEDGTILARTRDAVDKPMETTPEQMMDRVARGIAGVEAADQRQKWEREFRWLLDGFKFVPGGRILAAAGTSQQLTYYNCMPPEQEILTERGYQPIAEIQVGDRVVTHRNRLRRVLHKFERETQEQIFVINPRKIGYDALRLTGEHKVLAIRSEWVNTHRSRDGLKLAEEPAWIPARELKPGDYLAVAHDSLEEAPAIISLSNYAPGYDEVDGKLTRKAQRGEYHGYLEDGGIKHPVSSQLEIDAELCYLFGRWLGDGCVTHRTKTDIPSGIKIVFSLDEQAEAERLGRIIEQKFGVPTSLKRSSAGNWFDLWANSMILGQFFKAFFGAYSYGKRIPPSLMHLPNELSMELLKGLFGADGYASGKQIGIVLSNRRLATQVHLLLLRLGYFFSIKENTHRLGRHAAFRVSAYASECAPLFKEFFGIIAPESEGAYKVYFERDGLRWVRIDAIQVKSYAGPVLDLEIEEDHSFVSAGVVVSNCYVIPSPQDSRHGIVETLSYMMEIMSRGGGVGINISSLRPRYSYVKGVNGRSSGSVSWGALYSFVTGLIEQGGSRRGALMIILNIWHPDVEEFIRSKTVMGRITNANISVAVTDAFMEAVKDDGDWELEFPDTAHPDYDAAWDGNLEAWKKAGRPVNVYRTVKARELWDSIIKSAWASAEPGLYFIDRANKLSNSWYYPEGYLACTNPCGEQPLSAFAVCNLGALNLAGFAEDGKVHWEELGRAVRAGIRFLDDVIDATPYFLEENKAQQLSERRVGLGVMGLAEMLIRMNLRYGSPKSVQFIDQLFEFIAKESYLASADIAAEKGAFPKFDAEKFLESGYMRAMPEEVRRAVAEKGIRNVTLLTVAPTGCVVPETLVSLETGLRPIVELGDPKGGQWQPLGRKVYTDEGLRDASQFFVNGESHVIKLTTPRGFSLSATPNHQIRILDDAGNYVWRRMGEIQVGDQVVLKKHTLGDGEAVPLHPVEHGVNSLSDACPRMMTPEFAELLGLYMGDGYLKAKGGIHIVVSNQDPDLLEHVQDLLQRLWGKHREIKVEARVGCQVAHLNGRYISRFFETNGLAKPKGNPKGNYGKDAEGAFIPAQVLAAGKECVRAFLRGLFETDGTIGRGTISFSSTSRSLVEQAQVALLALGIVATQRLIPVSGQQNHLGQRPLHELRILNRREAEKFVRQIGFLSRRKQEACLDLGAMSDRGDHIENPALLKDFYESSKGLGNEVRQKILQRISNGALTQRFVQELVFEFPSLAASRLAQLVEMEIFIDSVETIEDGFSATYDLSVPDNHTYIANGFVSHNTTGTMVNTSTGVEPFFFWSFLRNSRLGQHEEKVAVAEEWTRAHPGQALPEHFVTAMDLKPEEHVRVQAAVQRWVDSAISKTCNVPENYTVEQTRRLYELMYELGAKGGTIYRDKSRDVQVLELKAEEKPKPAPAPAQPQPKVRPRPYKRHGATSSVQTPAGTAHVTMNDDDAGLPFEIFLEIGKAGSDLKAMAEAMGRLMSLVLRIASPLTPAERIEQIVIQLSGIGGARSYGFGKNRVLSFPDAVAQALAEHYGVHQPGGNGYPPEEEAKEDGGPRQLTLPVAVAGDLCPGCGNSTFVREAGCVRCYACGHSEC